MPEPEINTLDHQTEAQLDKVHILSNTEPQPTGRRRRKKPAPQYLQEDEIARLFRAITSVRDRAIFRLAYHAGLRASEIGLLDLRDYDPRTDRINVTRLKGSNSGQHHMVREEARALRAWLKERGNAPGAIFPSRRGLPISRKMLDVLAMRYGAKAGIPERLRHFHVLKHSCATHLLNKGINVELVQDWLGHADIRNTMEYARVSNRRRDEMAIALKD